MKRSALWAALLMLVLWSLWQFSQPAHSPPQSLAVLDVGRVHVMVLTPASGSVVRLEKQQGQWVLTGHPNVSANTDSVRRLLDELAAMRVIRVVTHTHAHDADLGMDKATELVLTDKTGNNLLALSIGKQGSDLISTYVRIGQSSEVLAVDKALVWQVRRNAKAWKAPSVAGHKPDHKKKLL